MQSIFTVKYSFPYLSALVQWCIQSLVKHLSELFGKSFHGYRALNIFVKSSILDVDSVVNKPLQVASQKTNKRANNCNHHKYGFWESPFKEENNFFFQTLILKRTLTKNNYYRKTCFVTRSICTTRLVLRSIFLTNRSASNTRLPTRTTSLSIRRTCLSILLSIHSTCPPTHSVFLCPLVVLSVSLFITDHNERNFL